MSNLRITNLTDHPSQVSLLIDIYNGTLAPGESANISANQINEKILGLVEAGYMSIGELPEYYRRWKFGEEPAYTTFIVEEIEESEPVVATIEPILEVVEEEKTKKKKGSTK